MMEGDGYNIVNVNLGFCVGVTKGISPKLQKDHTLKQVKLVKNCFVSKNETNENISQICVNHILLKQKLLTKQRKTNVLSFLKYSGFYLECTTRSEFFF
jgi:hypothetical protein